MGIMGKDRKPLGLLAVVALAALLFSAVVAGDALAGKPGSADATGATLTVSPSPAPLGTDTLTISGSGFRANSMVYINVAGSFPMDGATTDGSGAFSLVW